MPAKTVLFLSPHLGTLSPWITAATQAGLSVQTCQPDDFYTLDTSNDFEMVILWLPKPMGFLLAELEAQLPPTTLIWWAGHETYTTTQAALTVKPERIIGFCPMGLYQHKPVVTLAKTPFVSTDAQTYAERLAHALALKVHWINDTPGLVLPRIYAMLANEAAFALQEDVTDAQAIDTAMQLGTRYPIGPLAWADLVGLDTVVHILEGLWEVYREERYRPCLLLQKFAMSNQKFFPSSQQAQHKEPQQV